MSILKEFTQMKYEPMVSQIHVHKYTHTHTHTHTHTQIISHHMEESSEITHSKIKAAKFFNIGQRQKIKYDLIV